MKRGIKAVFSGVCTAVLLFSAGCESAYKEKKVYAEELTANMKVEVEAKDLTDEFISAYDDFAFGVFKRTVCNENTLISSLSASTCLSMAFNGADGETLKEYEKLFNNIPIKEQNEFYRKILNSADDKIKLADSVWVNSEKPEPEEEFLKAVKSYYDAEVFKAKFDGQLVSDINNWASNKTNGMIKKMLDDTSEDFYMYLMNALYFSSKWEEEYEKEDIYDAEFTSYGGEKSKVSMMRSSESEYLEFDGGEGFLKYYKGGKYAFVAMLPEENESVVDFAYSLSAESFKNALKNKTHIKVNAGIPKFSYEYGVEMSGLLKDMGLKKAFSRYEADFSKLNSRWKVFIDFVLQKTKIEVDESGTKAAAVTIIGMKDAACAPTESKTVILNRPFAYAIISVEDGLPLFIGSVSKL